ncbi:hypothetical protein V6Z11_A08G129000 [Gossypium hirsutum]
MHSFFVDVNLFKANNERAAGIAKSNNDIVGHVNNGSSTSTIDGLANEDANLMIKLKFLTYKLRTFLIHNGLSILFKDGPAAYRAYYLRQMKIWGTLAGKQRKLSKNLKKHQTFICCEGSLLASGSANCTIKLWDVTTSTRSQGMKKSESTGVGRIQTG